MTATSIFHGSWFFLLFYYAIFFIYLLIIYPVPLRDEKSASPTCTGKRFFLTF